MTACSNADRAVRGGQRRRRAAARLTHAWHSASDMPGRAPAIEGAGGAGSASFPVTRCAIAAQCAPPGGASCAARTAGAEGNFAGHHRVGWPLLCFTWRSESSAARPSILWSQCRSAASPTSPRASQLAFPRIPTTTPPGPPLHGRSRGPAAAPFTGPATFSCSEGRLELAQPRPTWGCLDLLDEGMDLFPRRRPAQSTGLDVH